MMEQLSENNPGQAGNPAATAATSLGRTLRETREHLGLSVADVANQIKFAPRQIEALEADDFKHLPEAAFLRGFVRSYAKILQLDTQPLLAALPQTGIAPVDLVPDSVEVPFPGARSLLRQNQFWLYAAALLAVVAGGFALSNFMSPLKQSTLEQSAAERVETPVSLPREIQIIPSVPVPDERVTVPPVPAATRARSTVPKAQSSVPATKSGAAGAEPQVSATKPVVPTQAQSAKPETNPETKPETKPEVKTESTSWWFFSSAKRDAKTDAKPGAKPEVKPEDTAEIKPEAKPVTPGPAPAPAEMSSSQPDIDSPITQLRLVFGEESWTEIKDRDGKIISSQVNPRGSELTVNGRAPFLMLIGHGLSVQLFHQGKPVDLKPYINKYSEVAHVTLQ